MYPRVVFVFWSESPIAIPYFFDCLRRALHELREVLRIIPIDEREGLVGEHGGRAAVDHVMDQDLSVSQTIPKRLDLVCSAQGDVMIRQPNIRAFSFLEFGQQFS